MTTTDRVSINEKRAGGETATGSNRNLIANVKEILRRIKVHNVTVSSAGIAFYGLLALVPTLIALVSVYAIVADPTEIEQQVTDAAGSLDETTKGFLTQQMTDIVGGVDDDGGGSGGNSAGRWISLLVGIAFALFSASGAVQKLMATVAIAYEAEDSRKGWKVRGLAYLFTAGAIVGVAAMVFLIGVLPAIMDRVELGGLAETLIGIVQLPALGIGFAMALTILYRYGPDRPQRTPWKNYGAVVGTLLFIVFSFLFTIYASNLNSMPASYGLLGSVAALMIFLQLTALAVIIGAEVNGALEAQSSQATVNATGSASSASLNGNRSFNGGSPQPAAPAEPLGLGKALAGLAALFALSRGPK